MPANLTPQYYVAEEAYKKARTPEEKLSALQEMLAVIPKHKGTEKIQGDLKKRIAKFKLEGERKSKGTGSFNPYVIEREGAGQLIVLGFPNVGKSTFVGALTNAKVNVSDFPFATNLPLAGMVEFEDIKIQLIDTPPVITGEMPGELVTSIMRSDGLIIVLDVSSDSSIDQLVDIIGLLEEKRVLRDEIPEGVKAFQKKDLLILANKIDLPGALENLEFLKSLDEELVYWPISAKQGANMEEIPQHLFDFLDVIRVYSKVPGQEANLEAPYVLPRGGTVLDLAVGIHKEFVDRLEKARVWGSSKFPGQVVSKDYVLADKDVVELHV